MHPTSYCYYLGYIRNYSVPYSVWNGRPSTPQHTATYVHARNTTGQTIMVEYLVSLTTSSWVQGWASRRRSVPAHSTGRPPSFLVEAAPSNRVRTPTRENRQDDEGEVLTPTPVQAETCTFFEPVSIRSFRVPPAPRAVSPTTYSTVRVQEGTRWTP